MRPGPGRTIVLTDKSKGLHIEAPGCIVNIRHGLRDAEGRTITAVEVIPDPGYDLPDMGPTRHGVNVRVRAPEVPTA